MNVRNSSRSNRRNRIKARNQRNGGRKNAVHGVRITAAFLLTASAVCFAGGCGVLDKFEIGKNYVFKVGRERCEPEDAKMILLNYQKEYGNLYGIDMLSHDCGENESLEGYIKDLTLSQLAEVYTLDVIAGEKDVTLSEEEEKRVNQAAEAYYEGLSKKELAYLGTDREGVKELYERYALSQKLYRELTEHVEQEVSDDEARVMRVKQIYTQDAAKADRVMQKLKQGEDFSALASANTEADAVDLILNRTTLPQDITEQVFSLKDKETSKVIKGEKGYYIFYCVKAFDEDLTESHKKDVLNQRMEEAVNGTYESYAKETDSTLNESVWEDVAIDASLKTEGSSFLEVYEKYLSSEEK